MIFLENFGIFADFYQKTVLRVYFLIGEKHEKHRLINHNS